MQVDPSIFKAYDIRGIYPDPLSEEVAYAIGRAFVALLECEEVVVGRDMRLSSPAIKEQLLCGPSSIKARTSSTLAWSVLINTTMPAPPWNARARW